MVVERLRAGRFTDLIDFFTPGLRDVLSADEVSDGWAVMRKMHGDVCAVGSPMSSRADSGAILVHVPVTCERGGFVVAVSINADKGQDEGQIAGLRMVSDGAPPSASPWAPASWVDSESFTERDVTIGAGPLQVSGSQTLPRLSTPARAVVLLSGSGPSDRDGTVGANKPLKDLAWGLGSRRIATLRYDKVTYAHAAKLVGIPDFTMVDEYVDHTVAAIERLQGDPLIDPAHIYLLGHSLGGSILPRIAARVTTVAGLIILAGGAQPIHHSIVRQVRYLAALRPGADVENDSAVQEFTRQADLIDSPAFSASTPANELPFNVPAPYWLDARGYDPVATAADLNTPMLILQGSRDYQVTVADDLRRWQDGLAHRTNVTFRIYPADNHFFFPGSGPSSPDEYTPPQHVDHRVITNISTWIGSQ
jgi:dienelactone hydrolase